MTHQQDSSIYSGPLLQFRSDTASSSGSQLAGTSLTSGELSGGNSHAWSGVYWSADMFADFSMGPLTCDPSEYPNCVWTTGGPGMYEATPATCEPSSKSDSSEVEGAFLPLVMIGTCNAHAQGDRLLA